MVSPKIALVSVLKDLETAPLSLAYLASFLKKNMEADVSIVDINFEDPLAEIKKIRPDIVGISSVAVVYNSARQLAKQIKAELNLPVIIGGVHVSTCPESFDETAFDVGVIGEGEETFLELIRLYAKEKKFFPTSLKKISGLIFFENGKETRTSPRQPLSPDKITIPDRSLLNKKYFEPKPSYNRLRGEIVREAGMLTSRGCPYKCVFCSTTKFWDKVRFVEANQAAQEAKELIEKFNINYIVIYDDLFAVSTKRLQEVYSALEKENLVGKAKFSCCVRANLINDETCALLKKMNVVAVNFGFESGSDQVLKYLKAGSITVEQNKKAVLLCKKYGFEVNGSFMIGSPGETKEDIEKTIELMDFLKDNGVKECWCGVTVPYPATQLWVIAKNKGLIDPKKFEWESLNPSYAWNQFFVDESITKKEFLKLYLKAKEKSFEMSIKKQSFPMKILWKLAFISPTTYFFIKKRLSQ
ncbi:B12-binding domain-containing radical SAM protein [Candidatus Woesearchaeota archaeon]|nr:B12-binding domain-containing radical SAM protein [Candidatus Woesearchaeota archaeon]